LFAGDQVWFGGDVASLLSLDQLGYAAGSRARVDVCLIFRTVGRTNAWAGAKFERYLDPLAGGIEPGRLVAQPVRVGASACAWPTWSTRAVCTGGVCTGQAISDSRAGLLLQPADIARQLIGRRSPATTLVNLIGEIAQRLALIGVRIATQRLGRLSFALSKLSVRGGRGAGRFQQCAAELLLGGLRQLIGLFGQVGELVPGSLVVAPPDGFRGGLARRNAPHRLGQCFERSSLVLRSLDARGQVRVCVRLLDGLLIGEGPVGERHRTVQRGLGWNDLDHGQGFFLILQ
jgi:hypothetical protein